MEKYQLKKGRWFVKWEDYQALMKKCGSGDLRRVELSGQETYDKLKSIIGYDPNRLTALCSGVLNPNVLYEEQSNSNFTGSLGGICVLRIESNPVEDEPEGNLDHYDFIYTGDEEYLELIGPKPGGGVLKHWFKCEDLDNIVIGEDSIPEKIKGKFVINNE